MKQILASYSASISELKKNPTALLNAADGAPVAILNHDKPSAYLVPAETYEAIVTSSDKNLWLFIAFLINLEFGFSRDILEDLMVSMSSLNHPKK